MKCLKIENRVTQKNNEFMIKIFTIFNRLTWYILHPQGIALTLLKLNSWSPGACFIPITLTKGINQIKKGILEEKSLYIQNDLIHFLKI